MEWGRSVWREKGKTQSMTENPEAYRCFDYRKLIEVMMVHRIDAQGKNHAGSQDVHLYSENHG